MNFFISATTDIGTKRKVNQDSLFVRRLETHTGNMAFAVLCDGMGGLKHGELASAALVEAFTEWMYESLPSLSQKPLEDYMIRKHWSDIIQKQNDKIRSYGEKAGCTVGSTITVLLLTEQRYFLLNIGDTRAYEIGSQVMRLTLDHTVAAKEMRRGNLTEEQANRSPMQNVLTKCVGVQASVCPDFFFGEVQKHAVYLLCSDGFRHHISEEEMREYLLIKGSGDARNMKGQEEYLVELNKQRGETDNISVITIFTD